MSVTQSIIAPVSAQSDFSVPFSYLSESHVRFEIFTDAETSRIAVQGTEYSFSSSGVIHFNTPLTAFAVVISRVTSLDKLLARFGVGTLPSSQINLVNQQLLNLAQEQENRLEDVADRALLVPTGEVSSLLPPVAQRAGKVLAFDGAGKPSTAITTALVALAIANATAALNNQELAARVTFMIDALAPNRILEERLKDGGVNVKDWGAKGDGLTNDTTALLAATNHANIKGKPLYVPTGVFLTSSEVKVKYGIYGDGITSVIKALPSSAAAWGSSGSMPDGRKAIVCIDSATSEPYPVQDFRILGAGIRPGSRTGNSATMGFDGVGLGFIGLSAAIHMKNIGVDFCYRGIDHATVNGHIGGTAVNVSNNWYGLYWSINSGDYRYIDSDTTGNLLASYGAHGSNRGGVDGGGVTGVLLLGTHGGFSPYLFYQEDGNGTVGIVYFTNINSSAEQIGNAVFRFGNGANRVSTGWNIIQMGHSWTVPATPEFNAYTIQGDANHPVQTYAVNSIGLWQGTPMVVEQSGWLAGTSGFAVMFVNLLNTVQDYRGPGLYQVTGQGGERLLGDGRDWVMARQVPAVNSAAGSVSFGVDNIPPSVDGLLFAEVFFNVPILSSTAVDALFHLYLNGVDQGAQFEQKLSVGQNYLNCYRAFSIPRRNRGTDTHTVEWRLKGLDTATNAVTVSNRALRGALTLRLRNNPGL